MTLSQFRLIYPECKNWSDKDVIKLLWTKFNNGLHYHDFENMLRKNKESFISTIVPDLYVKRGDAYLSANCFRDAIDDYNRALNGFPDYADAIDKWRLFVTTADRKHYLGISEVEYISKNDIKFWVKDIYNEALTDNTAYSITQYSINCSSKLLRTDSYIGYDSTGTVVNSWNDGEWSKIIPDSYGQLLFHGWTTKLK